MDRVRHRPLLQIRPGCGKRQHSRIRLPGGDAG
jgi:hypothetical protein